jgi:hypothetical protein
MELINHTLNATKIYILSYSAIFFVLLQQIDAFLC